MFISTATLGIGKLGTLVQPADAVFLLPKEKAMAGYFKQAKWRSLWLPVFAIVPKAYFHIKAENY